MIGVPRPYTGVTNAIRGITGGGLPWVVCFASGELKASGKVEVTVHGLVSIRTMRGSTVSPAEAARTPSRHSKPS
jgi:hypothetical protein